MYFDLESNIVQEEKPDSTTDKFPMEKNNTIDVQGTIVAMATSTNFVYFISSTDELYKWDRESPESLQQAYTLQASDGSQGNEMFKDQMSKIWPDHTGTHVIIKHRNLIFYFNGKKNKLKEIKELRGIEITALCFDDRIVNENNTGTILFSDRFNNIMQMQIDIQETKKDIKLNMAFIEKLCTLMFNENEKLTEGSQDKYGRFFNEPMETIVGIKYFKTIRPQENYTHPSTYICICTNESILQIQGVGGEDFKQIFGRFDRNPLLAPDMRRKFPKTGKMGLGQPLRSDIQILYKKDKKLIDKKEVLVDIFWLFGWATEAGFCTGKFKYENSDVPKELLEFTVTPYVKIDKKTSGKRDDRSLPIAVSHTDNHIFYLYKDCLTVISKLTGNIVHTQYLNQVYSGLLFDVYSQGNGMIILTSENGVYSIDLKDENNDIWQDYLEIGNFDKAIELCNNTNPELVKRINRIKSENLFNNNEYINAAVQYSLSDEKFETVCLKFLMKSDYESLKTYLEINMDKEKRKAQKKIITLWLFELCLSHENLMGKGLESFRKMVRVNKDNLDKETIYQLLQSYGKDEEFIEFASIMEDYETVILHYICKKDPKKALEELETFVTYSTEPETHEKIAKIFLDNSYLFFSVDAKRSIEILKLFSEESFNASSIVKALTDAMDKNILNDPEYIKLLNEKNLDGDKQIKINLYKEQLSKNESIVDFLRQKISKFKIKKKSRKSKEMQNLSNLHNLFVYFLSQNPNNEKELINYLKQYLKVNDNEFNFNDTNQKPLFKLEYTLKIFMETNNLKAQAINLALMGKYSDGLAVVLKSLNEMDNKLKNLCKNVNAQSITSERKEENIINAVKEKDDSVKELTIKIDEYLEIAKYICQNCPDEKLKKKLWLDIFDERKGLGFNEGLKIMNESKILKIEDVLPHITDDIKIEDFKNQISECISGYERNINNLKKDITAYNTTAENIKNDIEKVTKKSMEIQYKQCKCEICQSNIKDNNIYLFPCGHMFDAQCIKKTLEEYSASNPDDLNLKEKIKILNEFYGTQQKANESQEREQENNISTSNVPWYKNIGQYTKNMITKIGEVGTKKNEDKIGKGEKETKENREKLDALLSEQCVLCGDYIVDTVQCGLAKEEDKLKWSLETNENQNNENQKKDKQ